MPKARFSSLDVAAIVSSLRSTVLGYRISNVYDINPRTYLLKLAKAGDDAKLFVLIESGVRVHLTTYERDKAQIPSNFTLKLRKHVRTRRIEKVEQLGADRASACGAGPPRWCHSFGPRLPHALQRSAPVAAQHGAAAAATLTPTLTLTLALTLALTLTLTLTQA